MKFKITMVVLVGLLLVSQCRDDISTAASAFMRGFDADGLSESVGKEWENAVKGMKRGFEDLHEEPKYGR